MNHRLNGICNNREFLSYFLTENPLSATLRFAPINIWPIVEPYNCEYLLSLATIYAEARYCYTESQAPALRKAMVAGETLAARIPNTKFGETQACRTSLVMHMQYTLIENIFQASGNYNIETYNEYKNLPPILQHFPVNIFPATYPWTANEINDMIPESAVFIALYFAIYYQIDKRVLAIQEITNAYCALAKRGQVTDDFCMKITTSVRDELGVNVVLSPPTLNILYKAYMSGVNEGNAQEVFEYIDSLVPDIALRLKLTLQQAADSGLTLYTIIGRALRRYYDFPWGRTNRLTSGELQSFHVAVEIIGNNLYYGFKRDLGAARSTLYKSIGYVAKELLLKLNGETTLRRYAGLSGNIKNKNALNRLIANYIENYVVEDEPDQMPNFSSF